MIKVNVFSHYFQVDRVASDRTKSIGKILAECWVAELCHSKKARRDKNLAFSQANKKDCTTVTEGRLRHNNMLT